MTETTITGTPAAQPVETQPPAPPTPAASTADLEREIAELREQVAETRRTAEFWAERAKGQPAAAAPAAPVAAEPDEDVDVLEVITSDGTTGFNKLVDKVAKKHGYVSKDEVEQMIESRASTLSKEQELLDRYPDLKRKDSDFFKTTATHYGKLIRDGVAAQTAMEIAAEKAELDFMREGKLRTPESSKGDREAERLRRVAAQAGEGAGSRRPAAQSAEDDQLTPEQKRICAGMGISEEAYLKRAKAGVRMGGKPRQ